MTFKHTSVIYCNGRQCDQEFATMTESESATRSEAAAVKWTSARRNSGWVDLCPHCTRKAKEANE